MCGTHHPSKLLWSEKQTTRSVILKKTPLSLMEENRVPFFSHSSRRCPMGMLILSRKTDEVVQITVPPSEVAQVIKVMVVDIRADKARIGFDAHKSIMVHRAEIQRIVDVEGPIIKPEPPPVMPVVRIGDPLPGEL
jgi:carbon storage regulator CsrA